MPLASSTLSEPENRGCISALPVGAEIRLPQHQFDQETEPDHTEEPGNDGFQRAGAVSLQAKDGEGRNSGEDPGREQGNAEEEVQANRRAQEFGEIGGHRHQLGNDPLATGEPSWTPFADELREVLAGGNPQLGGKGLDQHRHQVGGDDDPDQHVPEIGASLDVGREVSRIDVSHGRNEGGAEVGHHLPQEVPIVMGKFFYGLVAVRQRGDSFWHVKRSGHVKPVQLNHAGSAVGDPVAARPGPRQGFQEHRSTPFVSLR